MLKYMLFAVVTLFIVGCTTNIVVNTPKGLPKVYKDVNASYQEQRDIPVAVFRLQNFTDTPRAGMRAANIVEGIFNSMGYRVISHVNEKKYTLAKAFKKAKHEKAKYLLYGGVSEWRYKTGIDGEPAVSLQLSLYKTKNKKLVWSATGSDSDWGNGSLGTTAQSLILSMIAE